MTALDNPELQSLSSVSGLQLATWRRSPRCSRCCRLILECLCPDKTPGSHSAEPFSRDLVATDPDAGCTMRPTVELNHVYVIFPAGNMVISDGVLKLLPRTEVRGATSAHRLLLSFFSRGSGRTSNRRDLARYGDRWDARLGRDQSGGIVFAQDKTAQEDSMREALSNWIL